jgi:hypothetical protein
MVNESAKKIKRREVSVNLFLTVTFVYVFLILTESYVTDFILSIFGLMSPHSPSEIITATIIRVAYLAGITITWLYYRSSWKKTYTAMLNVSQDWRIGAEKIVTG